MRLGKIGVTPDWQFGMFVFALSSLIGLVFGSFFNVLVYRIPRGESIVAPRSHCPECGTTLGPLELIPVFSWLIQRGRCRHCGARISWRYPAVELVTALLFGLVGWRFGWTQETVGALVLVGFLIPPAFIDLEHGYLPDVMVLPGLVLGLLAGAFGIMGLGFLESLLGAVFGAGVLLVVVWASRGGMGLGDVKLLAMIGAFLGWQGAFYTLLFGSVLGSIVGVSLILAGRKKRRDPIPFGPFLAAGAIVELLLRVRLW